MTGPGVHTPNPSSKNRRSEYVSVWVYVSTRPPLMVPREAATTGTSGGSDYRYLGRQRLPVPRKAATAGASEGSDCRCLGRQPLSQLCVGERKQITFSNSRDHDNPWPWDFQVISYPSFGAFTCSGVAAKVRGDVGGKHSDSTNIPRHDHSSLRHSWQRIILNQTAHFRARPALRSNSRISETSRYTFAHYHTGVQIFKRSQNNATSRPLPLAFRSTRITYIHPRPYANTF
jgi:hypothetical protein